VDPCGTGSVPLTNGSAIFDIDLEDGNKKIISNKMDPDPGGPKTCGSGSGFVSATLVSRSGQPN
jgi:hypothetical protein